MDLVFNESEISVEPFGSGAHRQHLLDPGRAKGSNIMLDRWALAQGASASIEVPARSLAWFFVIEGEVSLTHDGATERLTSAHTGCLPPRFNGALESRTGAALLYAEIPEVDRFDADFAANLPELRVIDWTREPVLKSEHDARIRIYVATPKLFGTKALKAEMIIYPPGTSGSNHHHEGAEHFKYVLKGRGTGFSNETPHSLRAGDLVWHPDGERHYSVTEGNENMEFIEFFVPGEYKSVWVNPDRICAWLPTGKNLHGEKPVRDIKKHSSAERVSPDDV